MNNYLKLHDYIRFRQEKSFVLMTNCLNMENFYFPSWTFKYLSALKEGICCDLCKNKRFITLLQDLDYIGALKDSKVDIFCGKSIFEKFERF